jgi:flagellar hook-basal body complex protein FliE
LKEFIKDVNELQLEAGEAVEKAITGEINDIHDVMIAVEKAKTSFELLMEVRNKMLEAYKELMRLQV